MGSESKRDLMEKTIDTYCREQEVRKAIEATDFQWILFDHVSACGAYYKDYGDAPTTPK